MSDPAGSGAHDLDVPDWDATPGAVGTVECFAPDDVEEIAAYVASYCSIQPAEFLERSTAYQAWAAATHATNTRSTPSGQSLRNTLSRLIAAGNSAKIRNPNRAGHMVEQSGGQSMALVTTWNALNAGLRTIFRERHSREPDSTAPRLTA